MSIANELPHDISISMSLSMSHVDRLTNWTNASDQLDGSRPTGMSFYNTVFWIVLYTVAVLLSGFCNVAVLIVQVRGHHCKTDMRPFLLSLACSDLLMGIFCIPFTSTYTLMQFDWVFPQPICKMVLFMQCTAVSSSVFTNIAIGLDRLTAILYPLKLRITNYRTRITLMAIWITAISISSVQFFVGDKFYDEIGNIWRCEEKHWPEPQHIYKTVYTWFLFGVTYALPLIILTITYSIVGCKLWFRSAPGNADAQRDLRQVKAKVKLVKMLATIVICFGLNWLPIYLFFILQLDAILHAYPILALNTYNCCHWLAMSNSFCNFWIYLIMNRSFRIDFLVIICRFDKKRYSKQWTTSTFRRSVTTTSQAIEKTAVRLSEGLSGSWRKSTNADPDPCMQSSANANLLIDRFSSNHSKLKRAESDATTGDEDTKGGDDTETEIGSLLRTSHRLRSNKACFVDTHDAERALLEQDAEL